MQLCDLNIWKIHRLSIVELLSANWVIILENPIDSIESIAWKFECLDMLTLCIIDKPLHSLCFFSNGKIEYDKVWSTYSKTNLGEDSVPLRGNLRIIEKFYS